MEDSFFQRGSCHLFLKNQDASRARPAILLNIPLPFHQRGLLSLSVVSHRFQVDPTQSDRIRPKSPKVFMVQALKFNKSLVVG